MPAFPDGQRVQGRLLAAGLCVATVLAILALAVLPLLTPFALHPALDAAGSASFLRVTPAEAHALSDRSVEELVLGPGSFAFEGPGGGPFYDTAERGHLGEARALLWLCLGAGLVSLVGLAIVIGRTRGARRRAAWRVVSWTGAAIVVVVVVLGLLSLVAFDSLFVLFHQVVFPGGGWSFDPASQHLVQLYPFVFWQIAAASFGLLVLLLGSLTWWLGRRLGRSDGPTDGDHAPAAAQASPADSR
jgi:integral membrane protein (TIGR01906 family)